MTWGLVRNKGNGGTIFDLNFNYAINYPGINYFQPFADPKFGMQYSGQMSMHNVFNSRFINSINYYFHVWFWVCCDLDQPFVILTLYSDQIKIDETISSNIPYFQVGMNGDGNLFFSNTGYQCVDYSYCFHQEVATNINIQKGWNYVGLHFDDIYKYTYVKVYHRSEMHTGATPYTIYETILRGNHRPHWNHDMNEIANIGCTTYHNYSILYSWNSTNNYNNFDPNIVYGLCMRGYIHTMEVFESGSRWDNIFNADKGATEITSFTNFIQDMIYENRATGKTRFRIGRGTGSFIFEDSLPQDTLMFYWDSSVANGVTSTNPKFRSDSIFCDMKLSPSIDGKETQTAPFYVPYVGRIFTNQSQHYICDISSKSSYTLMSFIPAMFTMEVWFRLDPIDKRPNGYISQLFSVYDRSRLQYIYGMAISNTFLRFYLNDQIEDIHYLFDETSDETYWHLAAVSYQRYFERETIVDVHIDQSLVYSKRWFDWHVYQMGSDQYQLRIGKNFPGVIRKAKINARPNCKNHAINLLVNRDPKKCIQKGDSACQFCDLEEETATNSQKYNCFPSCKNLAYYSNTKGECLKCHNGCRYCKDSNTRTNCYLCDSHDIFVRDTDNPLLIGGIQTADLMTCKCGLGTFTNDQNFCRPCDKRCAVCNHQLNIDCDMCAQGAYKIFQSTCVTKCPLNYVKDDINHICSFDMSLQSVPQIPNNPKGCVDGYFWSLDLQNCSKCSYNCLTCEIDSNQCTSCVNGFYLNINKKCELCENFFKRDMILGSSGNCIEACGDGKKYGMLQCDDGNSREEDGCSSKCIIQKDYQCYGGNTTSKDVCKYVPTEIIEVQINRYNDIIVKFS